MDIDRNKIDEEVDIYFCFKATLRISGINLDLENITNLLEITPTHMHKKGDSRVWRGKQVGKPLEQDMWSYTAKVSETNNLGDHLEHLWSVFKPHKEELLQLKEIYNLDIFCGYRSNCDHAGFEVTYESLQIFSELKIPFAVSVIIA